MKSSPTILQSTGSCEQPTLSICVSLKNRSRMVHQGQTLELFPNSVRSLVQAAADLTEEGPIELVIADFCSDDWPLLEWIEETVGTMQFQVISVEGSFSRGRGLNLAARHARSKRLFLCDADVLIEPIALRRAIEVVDSGEAWLPICHYLDEAGEPVFWQELGYGLVALNKRVWEQVKGVPEFESWGGEDNLFCEQVARHVTIIRERQEGLLHQWHPDAIRSKYYAKNNHVDFQTHLENLANRGIA